MWTFLFVTLLVVAVVDLGWLWQASRTGQRTPVLSTFTIACQVAFSVLAAFHVGPQAFANFSLDDAVQVGELVFLVLMLVGLVADARGRRLGRTTAR